MLLLPLTELPLVHIRAQQRPWLFFSFSVLKLSIQVVLNIYFVVMREMHVEGVVYSAVLSSLVMAVLLTSYSLYTAGIRVRLSTCKKLFSFSLPLKLAAIGSFYLTFGDRYFLNMFTDLTQVGIYALGYKFGFIFTMLAWTPFENVGCREVHHSSTTKCHPALPEGVSLHQLHPILFGLCISLFVMDLLRIMSNPAFWDAYRIVPIIIVAYIIQAWTQYCNLGILLEKKTMQIVYAEIIAVVVITAAYFILIPEYGVYGAAWATVIGFAARFYWTYLKSTRMYNMQLPWNKVRLTSLLALLAFGLSWFAPEEIIASIAVRSVLALGFLAAFFALPILTRKEKQEVWNLVLRRQRMNSIT